MAARAFGDLPVRQRRRLVVGATVRTIATIALVVTIYYLIPMDRRVDAATGVELVLGVVVITAVVAWQVWQISRSEHPVARGVEAIALTIPLFVLLFATTYFLMAHAQTTTFSTPLTRTDAMYFSTTVFTTVGFGDITAKTQAARVVVTVQMMLDLVVVGAVARLIVNAVGIGRQRHST
jgi:preprotein translocase subunit YajC